MEISDMIIPKFMSPRMGPADPTRVKTEAVRILTNQRRDEFLGENWRDKYTCWELQMAQEFANDFLVELAIAKMEAEEEIQKKNQ